jgi:opacity protein-like surface antigen
MKSITFTIFTAIAMPAMILALSAGPLFAQDTTDPYFYDNQLPYSEFYVTSGVTGFNGNDTALNETMVNIPVVVGVSVGLSRLWAIEGDVSYFIPMKQEVELDGGGTGDRKMPGVWSYMGNVAARMYYEDSAWAPYLTAGLGGMTFMEDLAADVQPKLVDSQTVFGMNFGLGTGYRMNESWSLRLDFREFIAFPGDDTQGLSTAGQADPIWIERGTVGLSRRF